jgi:peptide/nickel transport system permease protein
MTSATTNQVAEILSAEPMPEEQNQLQLILKRFSRHRLAMVSMFVVLCIFLISIFAKQLATVPYDQIDLNTKFLKPGTSATLESGKTMTFWLGSDHLGRDFYSRIIFAARISLTVAVIATIASTLIGVVVGAISGYYGGAIDAVIMRSVEFLLTIPTLPLLLILSSILLNDPDALPLPEFVIQAMGWIMLIPPTQARQVVIIIIVLVAFGWLGTSRLMRGMVLSLREQQFVEAARSMGASDIYIIFRHMIPNAMAPIIVEASLAVGGYIVGEAALSFLGFGVQDPIPTWGNMLSGAQSYMLQEPWLPLVPGLPIFICSLCFNFVGDGLRDALDPRLKL